MAGKQNDLPKHWLITAEDSDLVGEVLNDPLGLMSIWSRFGQRLVPHLTTVSNNVRLFHTAMLALDRLAEIGPVLDSGSQGFRAFVFAIEELVVHVQMRVDRDDTSGLRGIRAARRLAGDRTIKVGLGQPAELLSSQSANGMFAAVKTPLRLMGLIDDKGWPTSEGLEDMRRLFDSLQVDDEYHYLKKWIGKCLKDWNFCAQKQHDVELRQLQRAHASFSRIVLDPLGVNRKAIKEAYGAFWNKYLVQSRSGKDVPEIHRGARAVLDCIRNGCETSQAVIERLASGKYTQDASVSDDARQILALENVLSYLEPVFDVVARSTSIDNVAAKIKPAVLKTIEHNIAALDGQVQSKDERALISWILEIQNAGDAMALACQLIARHEHDAERRGRQPWVVREGSRVSSELPLGEDRIQCSLERLGTWARGYFIDSMAAVAVGRANVG